MAIGMFAYIGTVTLVLTKMEVSGRLYFINLLSMALAIFALFN